MSAAILALYFVVLGLLCVLGVHRFAAVLWARRYRALSAEAPAELPFVLVQLPLYNEAFVAERAVRSAAALRYPRGRLCVQVLDDSSDRTSAVVDRVVAELARSGLFIEVARRADRVGYKAGALAAGLKRRPEAEAVAIFDADFVPEPDFLERTVPVLLSGPDVGLVQARWGHLNRDNGFLTRAQGVFLDGHFAIEHAARAALGHPFNFNGTAGIWRRSAIEAAGGWQGDTITEDLDLSYRAQLAGWRFLYVHDVVVPAELPESWAAFRAQQARWVRGSIETARKLLGAVLRHRRWSLGARLDATIQLTNNVAYLLMAVLGVLLPGALVLREELGWRVPGGRLLLSALDLTMLGAGTLAVAVFYARALVKTAAGGAERALDLVFALCLGAGMSVSNAFEVLRGLFSRGSEFVRTPKRGSTQRSDGYRARAAWPLIALELALAAYHGATAAYAIYWQVWGALPFILLYLVGFAAVGAGSAIEASTALRVRSGLAVSAFETRRG